MRNKLQPTPARPLGLHVLAWLRRVAWLGFLAGGLASAVADSPEARTLEYQVKAAFLVKFGRFVEWPTNSLSAGKTGRFNIGILGQDPFGKNFDEAAKIERIDERPVHIVRGLEPADFAGCQIVFICASESRRLVELIREFAGKGILTVADEPDFASRGGMIGFIKEAGKVRFEINPAAAEKSGLKISSKLIQLGKRAPGRNPA